MRDVIDQFLREQARVEATGNPFASVNRDSGNVGTHLPIFYFKHQSLNHIGVMETSLL